MIDVKLFSEVVPGDRIYNVVDGGPDVVTEVRDDGRVLVFEDGAVLNSDRPRAEWIEVYVG